MRWRVWLTFFPAALLAAQVFAAAGGAPEYSIKAGYILLFTRYVEWPPSAFATPTAPIVICVLGTDPFGSVLDQTMAGQVSQQRPLSVRRVPHAGAAEDCHVVFMGTPEDEERANEQTSEWLEALAHRPVLTIGDHPDTLAQGATLCFVSEVDGGQARIRFEASLPSMQRAGLTASSQMLVAARKVHRQSPGM